MNNYDEPLLYECNIADKLIELRKAKGVTQEEVANALSVSGNTISKWENATSAPSLPLLVALSRYYNVSTDTLLGLGGGAMTTDEVIANECKDLDRCKMALKLFEIEKAAFPSCMETAETDKDTGDPSDALPVQIDQSRYQILWHEMFHFAVCSDDVNLAVLQLRNRADFAWLIDSEKQKRMRKLLIFLADYDTLNVMAFLHSQECSDNFTADYMSKNTGVSYEKTVSILEECCALGFCSQMKAHLKSGEIVVYESVGDGLILSILSLVYERMCGKSCYAYNYYDSGKMIGGEGK